MQQTDIKENKDKHNRIGSVMHWELRKWLELNLVNKEYQGKPEFVWNSKRMIKEDFRKMSNLYG